ncbi:MAG: hypothetical protein JRM73_00375 [Nitrososphaerota archaeon]|nr:hypothetical protein [Nitrososphaerota archaeon]
MRYLDLAVAVLVGTSAVAGVSAWSPAPGDSASARLQTTMALRDDIAGFVQSKGMSWFFSTPPEEVCSVAYRSLGPADLMSAEVGAFACPGHPPASADVATLTFRIATTEVTLTAWSDAAA